jgi:subtilisin family serine protease
MMPAVCKSWTSATRRIRCVGGTYDTTGTASGVQVVGALAYVADGPTGLQVLNVSDSANPFRVGGVDTPGFALRVEVVGTWGVRRGQQHRRARGERREPGESVSGNGLFHRFRPGP